MRRIAAEVFGRAGRAPARPGSSGELVFAGPLPPAPTGVATYDRAVLDGFRSASASTNGTGWTSLWPIEPKDTPRLPGYRLGIFQMGNNVEFHLEVYRAAFLTPALVVLHDLALDDFVRGLKSLGDPLGLHGGTRGDGAPPEPDLARRGAQRAAARSLVRARGAARARPHRPQRVREAVPRETGLPHAGLRRAPPGGGDGGGHGAGRRRAAANCVRRSRPPACAPWWWRPGT